MPLDSAVNVAFQAIATAFGLALPGIQWVVIGCVLTCGSLMQAVGRLGAIFGHARVCRFALAWSMVAYLLLALVHGFGMLLARLLSQGIGVGLFTLAYTDSVTATMRREERGVAGSLTMLTRTLGVVSAASLLMLVFGATEAALLAEGELALEAFLAAFARAFWLAGLLPLLVLPLLVLPLLMRQRGAR